MSVPQATARLSFREMEDDDLEVIHAQLGDPTVMWMLPEPYSREQSTNWIKTNRRLYSERGYGSWILTLRETGAFAGECGFGPEDVGGVPEVEIGYYLPPSLWGNGLIVEAGRSCLDFARRQLGLRRIVALIDPRNDRSMRTAVRLGMAFERRAIARNKDYSVFSIQLQDT
jgi:RimJ/RimL family protein N-acetyltransferase